MSAQYDILVDFNTMDSSGQIVTYADRARPGVDLHPGTSLTVGDGEGLTARATITGRRRWQRIPRLELRIDGTSFTSEAEGPQ